MRAGFPLPKFAQSVVPEGEVADLSGLAELRRAVARYSCELPAQPNPAFVMLTLGEWTNLHCRHSELRLSFLVPPKR
jgi:hypothetical protein